MATITTLDTICSVCGEPLETHTQAFCDACGKPYHLNQRTDLPGKDCGQVWINDEHLSLEFACNACLHPPEPEGALDDVIDSAEAAVLAGRPQTEVVADAEGRGLHHRKTASGVYLFERGDVIAFYQIGR